MSVTIQCSDVVVARDGRRILAVSDLTLESYRIAVIGANGSGKSTFARLLNGLITPDAGTVRVNARDGASARVGFVFSSPEAQLLMPTAAEDVALSLRRSGLTKAEIAERVAETLARYGLAEHADTPVHALSGGQKQLLACASVLVTEPDLVVADEPTTLLDLVNTRRIADLLLDDLPMPSVIVTHDLALAERCDVAVLFEQGRVVAVDAPAAVTSAYRELYA